MMMLHTAIERLMHQVEGEDAAILFLEQADNPARVFDAGFCHRDVFEHFIALVPGATIEPALAVICGEATRLYLAEPDEQQVPALSAQLLVNFRNAGAHALAGKKMALQRVELSPGVESLVERLYASVGSNVAAGESGLQAGSHMIHRVYENIPAPLLAGMGRWSRRELRALEAGGSCAISTLSGPAQAAYFLGAKRNGLLNVSALYKGCGLMYSASQYQDQIAISMTSGAIFCRTITS